MSCKDCKSCGVNHVLLEAAQEALEFLGNCPCDECDHNTCKLERKLIAAIAKARESEPPPETT